VLRIIHSGHCGMNSEAGSPATRETYGRPSIAQVMALAFQ
jgi:hypothetical protein